MRTEMRPLGAECVCSAWITAQTWKKIQHIAVEEGKSIATVAGQYVNKAVKEYPKEWKDL